MKGYEKSASFEVKKNGETLIRECYLAKTHLQRLFGLITVPDLKETEALLFKGGCQQMHSLFMRYPIDLVFLGSDDKVLATQELRPWRFTGFHMKARSVLEMSKGSIERLGLKKGDHLEVPPC